MVFSMIYDDLGKPPMTSETTKCRTGPHLAKGRFGGAGFTADRGFWRGLWRRRRLALALTSGGDPGGTSARSIDGICHIIDRIWINNDKYA